MTYKCSDILSFEYPFHCSARKLCLIWIDGTDSTTQDWTRNLSSATECKSDSVSMEMVVN